MNGNSFRQGLCRRFSNESTRWIFTFITDICVQNKLGSRWYLFAIVQRPFFFHYSTFMLFCSIFHSPCWFFFFFFWFVYLFYQLPRDMLKSPTMTVDVSISPFSSARFCFMCSENCCKMYSHSGLLCLLGESIVLSLCKVPFYP